MANQTNRRDFLVNGIKISLLSGLAPAGFSSNLLANGEGGMSPKFMLNIVYALGLSQNYLFDSRPANFTGAGLFVNNGLNKNANMRTTMMQGIRGRAPYKLADKQGRSTYVNPIVDPILKGTNANDPNSDHMVIINGVHMNFANDEGHDTNRTRVLSGASGSDYFFFQKVPDFRSNSQLVYLEDGLPGMLGPKFNTNPLSFASIIDLSKSSTINKPENAKLFANLAKNYETYGKSNSSLRSGSAELIGALKHAKELHSTLESEKSSSSSSTRPEGLVSRFSVDDLMTMIRYNFEFGISNYATLVIDADVDSHGQAASIQDPDEYARISSEISQIFDYLGKTSFVNSGRKMRDDILTLVSSEFNRTTYGATRSQSIFSSGTDHNPYGNTVVLYGGGIRGLQVIGQTDGERLSIASVPDDWMADGFGELGDAKIVFDDGVRKLHASQVGDRQLVGKAFDFKAQKVIENYTGSDRKDFITMDHIHNSILKHFGVTDQDLGKLIAGGTARDYIINLT